MQTLANVSSCSKNNFWRQGPSFLVKTFAAMPKQSGQSDVHTQPSSGPETWHVDLRHAPHLATRTPIIGHAVCVRTFAGMVLAPGLHPFIAFVSDMASLARPRQGNIYHGHMFSHNGYGPGTKAQGHPGPGPAAFGYWSLVLSAGLICVMAEHMCIKGNH